MPHLTFPVSPDGLALDVFIGHDAKELQRLQEAGQPFPPPIKLRAFIDSCSDLTAISQRCLAQMGLGHIDWVKTDTAGGSVEVKRYRSSLSIRGIADKAEPMYVSPSMYATALATELADADALIGKDVLNECLFILDGPGKQFTLAF
jgi:hypothetical protein